MFTPRCQSFQVIWESKSLSSLTCFYFHQPLEWHCLLLSVQPHSLSAWTFYKPIAPTLRLRLILHGKYLAWAIAGLHLINEGGEGGCNCLGTPIAPYSHSKLVSQCLLPLILTNSKSLALKLGNGQKLSLHEGKKPWSFIHVVIIFQHDVTHKLKEHGFGFLENNNDCTQFLVIINRST